MAADSPAGLLGVPRPDGKPDDATRFILPPTGHYWTNAAGSALHIRSWLPAETAVRGTLFFVHGYSSHVNRRCYDRFFRAVSAAGFVVCSFDLQGHGYSAGERAVIEDFAPFVTDILEFIQLVMTAPSPQGVNYNLGIDQRRLDSIRLMHYHLAGCSMGGALVVLASVRLHAAKPGLGGNFRGTVCFAPALIADMPPAPVRWLLQNIVAAAMPMAYMPRWISRGNQIETTDLYTSEEDCECDELDEFGEAQGALGTKKPMRWCTAVSFVNLFAGLEATYADVHFPFLIFHDPKDAIAEIRGSRQMLELSPSPLKRLIEVPGGLHEVHVNKQAEVLPQLLAFLTQP